MLRVSEFCRGPLSPVPSSGSRRRRRPSFDHSHNNEEESCNTLDHDALSSTSTTDDEEEISCTVKLRVWNRPSSTPPDSAECARIPLDVLKSLSLRDGDYAFLEKHQLIEMDEKIIASRDTILEKVAIRLQLMDEDEELELTESMGAATDDANNLCLVAPIVLANLGFSPRSLWEQTRMKSFPLEETGIFFRLCAMHDYLDDGSSGDDNVGIVSSPWMIAKRRNIATCKRRMKTAGRVLLRPLGRSPLWPLFPLTSSTTAKDNNNNQISQSQDGGSFGNLSSFDGPKNSSATAASVKKESKNEAEDDTWIYPSRSGVVLQESKLCEVRYNTNSSNVKQNICYYEVLRIFSSDDDDEEEDGFDKDQFYVTAPCTQFELDSCPISALSYVRRLPLPSPSSSQDDALATTDFDDEKSSEKPPEPCTKRINGPFVAPRKLFSSSEISPEKDNTLDDLVFSCHPDWKKVANALLDAPPLAKVTNVFTNGSSPDDSRILHIVGTDVDHNLEECVTTAASMVGMQCLSIKGLAAFGYEHRRSKGGNGTPSSGVTVRSPMIEQQHAGVDAALEYIQKRRMEPCVLHISGVDEELASVAPDDQLRCQVEDRLWSKWTEGVATISIKTEFENQSKRKEIWGIGQRAHREESNFGSDSQTENRWDYRYTPRILIIISTKTPLKRGPWLERLIFPSISLSLPDEKYINYLWNHSKLTNSNDESISKKENDEKNVLLSTEMMPLLRGRPAQEIIQLKQLMSAEMKGVIGKEKFDNINSNGNDEMDLQTDGGFQLLEKLCKDFDAGRRTASSDVSRISSVSWEDVGGLDHVRAEILDAIELPLKHPHLFPPNTGRSGILLFGPPGTGKTLVAKAVATECGLPFLSVKGPELLGSYIGESEANIRKVFSSARLAAENNLPVRASILFFDELDSLAPKRGGNSNHGGGVMERVVASLLAELDGGVNHKDNHGRVFVLGATNRPDLLDPSLLRPGRLDRLVYLGIPTDNEERTRVLASQLRKMKLEGDAVEMARSIIEEGLPPRLSGADMSKLSSGAMLNAIRRLCREADQEREELLKEQQKGNKACVVTIDEILESWGEEKCTPIITLDDLRVAAKDVSSSVSDDEMQRYERLRAEHETSFKQSARA